MKFLYMDLIFICVSGVTFRTREEKENHIYAQYKDEGYEPPYTTPSERKQGAREYIPDNSNFNRFLSSLIRFYIN